MPRFRQGHARGNKRWSGTYGRKGRQAWPGLEHKQAPFRKRGRREASSFVETNTYEIDAVGTDTAPTVLAENLSLEQKRAAEQVFDDGNLFITGAAGTGKSFLLRYIIQELKKRHPSKVAVTAPTGIAAMNIGGQTIHSFAGVGLGVGSVEKLRKKVQKSKDAVRRWKETQALVLDEVSMLDAKLFDALESIARSVRGSSKAFGGIQLILCGDFFQLPPVEKKTTKKSFCFQTSAWRKCGLHQGTVNLQEQIRQSGDAEFAKLLSEVRHGIVSERTKELLAQCHVCVKASPADGIVPTKLYCTNRRVDAENQKFLDSLPGKEVAFKARDIFKTKLRKQSHMMLIEQLDRKVPTILKLKRGAQVILIRNQANLKLVNGSRGVVEDFQDGKPVVRFDVGCSVRIGVEAFDATGVKRLQVPLKLAWALTVHKAQGMTLTRAELQVDDAFDAGQAYVALSRLTCAAGLWIHGDGLVQSSTWADPRVVEFYNATLATSKKVNKRPRCSGVGPSKTARTGNQQTCGAMLVSGSSPGEARQETSTADTSVRKDPDLSFQSFSNVAPSTPHNHLKHIACFERLSCTASGTIDLDAESPVVQRSSWVEPPRSWGGVISLDD